MLHALWTAKSLRYWIAVGMTVAIAPLAVSAVAGYVLLNRDVIASFHDASARERTQVAPTQHLRILLWDTLVPVDEFVDEGGAERPAIYRAIRSRIETQFASLHEELQTDPGALLLVERARGHWTDADRLATELVSVPRPPGDPEAAKLMERFHGAITASSDKLGSSYELIAGKIQEDHDIAVRAYEKSQWLAAIAAAASLIAILGGIFLIGRVMAASVDRLVDGAERFAEGDRDHRIEVRVPPELRRVAEEFNRMIARIHDSESALAELARRDGLTRLLNRRAFDEALAEMYARMRRTSEEGALLTMDIDFFKRINDTYGHSAGDDVLRAFAKLVTADLRPFDQAFRVGGEEFSVLLPGVSMVVACDMAERLREAVAAHPIAAHGEEIPVTVSIGVAKVSEAVNPNELVDAADAALYRAKTTGRNRVVSIDEFGAHESGSKSPSKPAITA